MLTFQGAYLIRCWRRDRTICRIEITHVATGERVLVQSTAAAVTWIGEHQPSEAAASERR
ncbi:MAG TPA: hypothetical protein VKX16_14285 [Chloroflexota bacterium]|nr:hypothetical protein [Chloroflexota bacterium]